jgi:hypothetical protein
MTGRSAVLAAMVMAFCRNRGDRGFRNGAALRLEPLRERPDRALQKSRS